MKEKHVWWLNSCFHRLFCSINEVSDPCFINKHAQQEFSMNGSMISFVHQPLACVGKDEGDNKDYTGNTDCWGMSAIGTLHNR